MSSYLYSLADSMRVKRNAQTNESGFTNPTMSEHMCAILRNKFPIVFGSNYHKTNQNCMYHAEYDALSSLLKNKKYKKENECRYFNCSCKWFKFQALFKMYKVYV
jgi:hypothetical protein